MSRGIKRDNALKNACADLKNTVNNFNKLPDLALRQGSFRSLNPETVFSVSNDGWTVGYQLKDLGDFMNKTVFIKCNEQPISEVPDTDREAVFSAVYDVFFDFGWGPIEMDQPNPFMVRFDQLFSPLYLVERNPNIVTPGRA